MQVFLQRRGHHFRAHKIYDFDIYVRLHHVRTRSELDVRRRSPAAHAERQLLPHADSGPMTPASAEPTSTAQPMTSGYIVAPPRLQQPTTATSDVIRPISRTEPKQLAHIPSIGSTRHPQTEVNAANNSKQAVSTAAHQRGLPQARNEKQLLSTSSSEVQQQKHKQQTTTSQTWKSGSQTVSVNSSSKLRRLRGYDPAKAFLHAGMPAGLWVLPGEASADAPAAPPPLAPEVPEQLLTVLQRMPPPRRRLVVFKAGGYIYSEMEALIAESGLAHVLRLTNLIRKAHCVLAKPVWVNGRHVNLKQHQAAATKAKVPFLIIDKLDAVHLVEALRPALIRKRIVVDTS